jgi:2,4-dienoyl-CoA reductase-like NADH-dependent reductase (Old Yellow Enzyme family)/thioredoxin reductase
MAYFETLFKPIIVKGIPIRNRIVMAPMNTNFADFDGSVNKRFTRYYVERGKGGAGLIIVSGACIDATARKRIGSVSLYDDRFISKLKEFSDAVHATGAKVIQQINHNGRLLTSSKELKTSVLSGAIGPSAIPHILTGELCKALTVNEIKDLIEKFGQTARRAKEAGFDGVEIHGTHGYLINQFFSLYSNRRRDAYGGNLENRMRFPLEVYQRVRELVGNDFLVCYRVNMNEFSPIETPIQDTIALCQRLEKEGVDLIDCSAGNSETPATVLKMIPPMSTPRGCYADLAATIKTEIGIPIIVVGRINTPEVAEEILKKGKADLVAIGRGFIADPFWPEKAQRGELEKIRRCIGCNQGCMEQLIKEGEISCIYNPEVGREGELNLSPVKKKVWVVGGGPAGMEAAVIAASRGHKVEIFEKEKHLGGQSLLAASPPGKQEFYAISQFLANELKRLQVAVHLDKEMTAAKVIEGQADVVFVATGSVPTIPEIPGIEKEFVVTAIDVLKGKEFGEKVVVIGGGLVGVETALFISEEKKETLLIEMTDEIAHDAGPLNRARLKDALRNSKVDVRCKTKLLGIGEKLVTVRNETKEYDIETETVVLAVGAKAQDSLHFMLGGKVPELYAIGDCVRPRKLLEAIHEAHYFASRI